MSNHTFIYHALSRSVTRPHTHKEITPAHTHTHTHTRPYTHTDLQAGQQDQQDERRSQHSLVCVEKVFWPTTKKKKQKKENKKTAVALA